MTEPLSTVCDHCDAKLKLKNPDLEGKKIKCPKCGEAFVAVAAGSKPAATKIVKKKKASEDDELDFTDDDAEDYDAPPDDDDLEDYDSPRGRRSGASRGGKKKSKKKSKRSGNSALVVKILVIALGVAVLLGGGGFAVMSLTAGGASDVDWLPADVQGYVKIQVDDVWRANALQGIKNGPGGQKFVEEMTRNIGVGPLDVDQMIVGLPATGQANAATMLVRSKKPLDAAAMLSANPGATQISHNGSSYLKMADNTAVFLPDSKSLIKGPESAIQALMARGKKNPSESKFAFARNCRDHMVMAMLEPSPATGNSMAANPLMFASGQNTETVLVRANASSDIRVAVQGAFKTAEAAKINADKMKADLEKGKAEISKAKTQLQSMPPNPLIKADQVIKLMNGAEQVLKSVKVSQSGSRINIDMSVSGQLISDFTDMASSIPGAPSLGFPMPFGTR